MRRRRDRPPSRAKTNSRTRREFVRDAAVFTAGASVAGCFPDVGGYWATERAGCQLPLAGFAPSPRVVDVHDELSVSVDAVSGDTTINDGTMAPMLADLLGALSGAPDDPWPVLLPDFVAGMRIGLKVNVLNPQCATSLPLVRALCDDLQARFGVPADDILVWDRRLDELTRSGFTREALGVPVLGTIETSDGVGGPGYEEEYCAVVSGKRTRLSRILTELTDITINCPVLKAHGVSGVTGAMKNIYGVIDNPFDFHDDLNVSLPALYALTPVHSRIRLTVLDALIAVTVGGTSSPPDAVPRRLLASADPVALDAYALTLVNEVRAAKATPQGPIDAKYTAWIDNAEQAGLGARAFDLRGLVR